MTESPKRSLARLSLFVLAYTILVILWGALVRASNSGAGCGNHWPLCNGEFIIKNAGLSTYIEYGHRIGSGLCLLLVASLLVVARKHYSAGSRPRRLACWALFFTLLEAAIGAVLVLLELVGSDSSASRAIVIAVHLVNTLLLLASLTLLLTASREEPQLERTATAGSRQFLFFLFLLTLTAASGAITALGDTLFPAASLTEGIAADLAPEAHFLLRLRVFHPLLAIVTAAGIAWYLLFFSGGKDESRVLLGRNQRALLILLTVQLGFGFLNLLLLAPIWMQIVHLALADAIWIYSIRVWDSYRVVPIP